MASNTILIVDSPQQPGELNTTFLQQPGIRLLSASRGTREQGVIAVARRESPGLILGEMGRSDLELCHCLKREPETARIPLIVVAGPELVTELKAIQPERVLTKPVVPRELYEAVHGFVPLPERSHRRYEINLRFTFQFEGRTVQVFSRNVSLNGALLKTDRPIPKGTHLQVCFFLPGEDREICCGARVVQSRLRRKDIRGTAGLAIEFEGVRDRDLVAFESFIVHACAPRYRTPRILSNLF